MDRHKCKFCVKSFSNGRALGGHMRSHMVNLIPPAPAHAHLSCEDQGDSAPFLSSPSSSEGDAEEKGLCYGLRENPKRSIRMVDPEFSFGGSVVNVQDRESETESSKNPTRRRSKRTRKPDHHHYDYNNNVFKRVQEKKQLESWTEAEPVSSISGSTTTREEDVAFWLMMLSRDKWTTTKHQDDEDEEEEEEEELEDDESMEEMSDDWEGLKLNKNGNGNRGGNYECETCNKVFGSYQALGGHRASHKKIKVVSVTYEQRRNAAATITSRERKIHECPVCLRVFSSGQALGGHKRSHLTAFSSVKAPPNNFPQSLIDLNLPAPFEEDHLTPQIQLSPVSDAHHFLSAITQ